MGAVPTVGLIWFGYGISALTYPAGYTGTNSIVLYGLGDAAGLFASVLGSFVIKNQMMSAMPIAPHTPKTTPAGKSTREQKTHDKTCKLT
jgi:hypothetical protein